MRRLALLATLGLFAIAPAAARADQNPLQGILLGTGPGEQHAVTRSIWGQVSGQVVVTFSPAASGCAALDACGYSGTEISRPGAQADVQVTTYVRRHRPGADFELSFTDFSNPNVLTYTGVHSAQGGTCVDETQDVGGASASGTPGHVRITLAMPGTSTRCAGPLPSDLLAAMPTLTISPRQLLRGPTVLDFHSVRTFTAHGFTGTVTSTVVVRLGRARAQSQLLPPGLPRPPEQRTREVTLPLSLTSARGALVAGFTGSSDTNVCLLLDSCGIVGTVTMTPSPAIGTAQGSLFATGPAKRPLRDFLTAMGLASGGRPAGIQAFGIIVWDDRGAASARLTQNGQHCADTAPLGYGFAVVGIARARVIALYAPGYDYLGLGNPSVRTRCPGPTMTNPAQIQGAAPLSVMHRRSFTIALSPAQSSAEDDGYIVALHGQVWLTFTRGPVTQRIVTTPAGF
jgi:hypothetical protein